MARDFVATTLHYQLGDDAPNEGPQKSPAKVPLSRKSVDFRAKILRESRF